MRPAPFLALAALLSACGPKPDPEPKSTPVPEPAPAPDEEPTAPSTPPPPEEPPEYSGAPRCPPPPPWMKIDPAQVTGLPGDEVEYTVAIEGGTGRITSKNPWLHVDPDAAPAPTATATIVVNEHTQVFRGVNLEAERRGEPEVLRCAAPEIRVEATALDELDAEERRDVTDIAFHGGVLSIAGGQVSFSYTDGLEEKDCGHHVVPVSKHWVRESADTGRLYIAIEDRAGGETCSEDPVTPRAIARAPIPDGITQIHVIFDLVKSGTDGPAPYRRHEKTVPVSDDSHMLSPR